MIAPDGPEFIGESQKVRVIGTTAAGVIAATFGTAALLGWVLGLRQLASLKSTDIPMAPSTALVLILFGGALGSFAWRRHARNAATARTVIGILGILASLAVLVLAALGRLSGAEKLGLETSWTMHGTALGHMSPVTAVCLLMCGIALVSLRDDRSYGAPAAFIASGATGVMLGVCIACGLAYLLGSPLFYGSVIVPPALSTVLALLSLGAGFLFIGGAGLRHGPLASGHAEPPVKALALGFALLTACLVTAGYLYHRGFERRVRQEVEQQLAAVAELKAAELAHWRQERLADAVELGSNPHFTGSVRQALDDSAGDPTRSRLLAFLSPIRAARGLDRVSLLRLDGREFAAVPGAPHQVSSRVLQALPEIVRSRGAGFVDFYRDTPDGPVFLGVVAPIFDRGGSEPLAVLFLRIDPAFFLYPLINRWPNRSKTAETLLVRREGEEVVFLNSLQFDENAALRLRIPLTRTDVPAVAAALGRRGVIEGTDYRGVAALAWVRPVPDSPWFMVARIANSEVYAPVRERLWQVMLFVGALVGVAAAAVGSIWWRMRALGYRALYSAADSLRQSEAKYRRTLDSMMEGAQILDRDWRYVYLNKAAAAHGRQTREELLGRTLRERYPGIESTAVFTFLHDCMERREAGRQELEVAYPEGDSRWFELKVQPTPEGLFILSLDITDRKQAEEALRRLNIELERRVQERTAELGVANRELEAFAYSVSHDLRAPLRSIDGFSLALLEDHGHRLDGAAHELLARVRLAAQHMGQLIDDLLLLSRITRADLDRTRVDLSNLSREVLSAVAERDPARQVQTQIQEGAEVYGDPRMLQIVLSNLLENAWKFTSRNPEARIGIRFETIGSEVCCHVSDNGIGFDMAYADKLFGAFQRLHPHDEYPGTGIGLATVRRVIDRHGGRVWATGESGRGATFSFTLPQGEEAGCT